MYLSEKVTREAFLRLRQPEIGGKKWRERTSALMTFLAFDALLKRIGGKPPIDLDPETANGKANRDVLTGEFIRIIRLRGGSEPCYVFNLGEVTVGGPLPEKIFSGNFLTVPLKAATTSRTAFFYPSRPKNPLLALGRESTGLVWGIDRHEGWSDNLSVFLEGRNTKTPFHDLACLILRQRSFPTESSLFQESLLGGLSEIFTPELCSYWKTQLSLEKVYAEKVQNPFQETAPDPFSDCVEGGRSTDKTMALSARIKYLEGLLKLHHINFEE